jgi:cell division protein FtsW
MAAVKRKLLPHFDFNEAKKWSHDNDSKILLSLILLISLFGLVMVFSSSSIMSMLSNDGDYTQIFVRQLTAVIIGFVGIFILSKTPAVFIWRIADIAIVGALFLQFLVVATPLGVSYGGNTNWLQVGSTTVQPSEFLKLALIIWIAKHVEMHYGYKEVTPKKFFTPIIIVSGLSITLVMLGRDLGTTSIIMIIIMGSLYFSGVKLRYLLLASVVTLFAAVLYAFSGRGDRILVWLNGCSMELYETTCWQIMHGQWALAEGGIFGAGLGNSKSKWSWLPHAESDFIFAIIGEETGMVGASITALAFLLLMLVLIRIARNQNTVFGRVIISGVMVWIVLQAFVNIAVVLQILPVLGVPLPLISAGGSGILSNLLAFGVVFSMINYNKENDDEIFEENTDDKYNSSLYFWRNEEHNH